MARFCTKCGAPAPSDDVKFCAKCGASLPNQTAQAPAQSQPSPPAQAPPAGPVVAQTAASGSSTLVKVLVAVLGLFFVLGALAIATVAYLGYKAKKKFDQAKVEYGLNNTSPPAQAKDVCSLLTKEEATQFTGITVNQASGSTTKCTYYTGSSQPVLVNEVSWDGARLALKLGVASLRAMSAGVNTVVSLPGIGDEAYTIGFQGKEKEDLQKQAQSDQSGGGAAIMHLMGMSPLMFRKGDVMVTVRLIQAQDPDNAKQAIAKAIVPRL